MPLGTSDVQKSKGRRAPAAEEGKAADKPAEGLTRIYPTHRRQSGDLVVALPSALNDDGDSESAELVITDEGADVADELADQLIAAREATTDAPSAAEG